MSKLDIAEIRKGLLPFGPIDDIEGPLILSLCDEVERLRRAVLHNIASCSELGYEHDRRGAVIRGVCRNRVVALNRDTFPACHVHVAPDALWLCDKP